MGKVPQPQGRGKEVQSPGGYNDLLPEGWIRQQVIPPQRLLQP